MKETLKAPLFYCSPLTIVLSEDIMSLAPHKALSLQIALAPHIALLAESLEAPHIALLAEWWPLPT